MFEMIKKNIHDFFGTSVHNIFLVKNSSFAGCYEPDLDRIRIRDDMKMEWTVEVLFHELQHRFQYENKEFNVGKETIHTHMYGSSYEEILFYVEFRGVRYNEELLDELKYENWPWEIDAREVAKVMTSKYFKALEETK